MRGVDAHLAQNLEALSHDIGEVVQDLSEITAGLALDLDRRHEELHVHERHAHGEVVERLLQRQAEVLLLETLLELDPYRRRQLVGHHAHRALERVAGANRARQQVQRFGELLLELAQAAAALDLQPHDRRRQAHERRHERRQPEAREQQGQKAQPGACPEAHRDHGPGVDRDARLFGQVGQPRARAGAAHEAIDDRQRARPGLAQHDAGGGPVFALEIRQVLEALLEFAFDLVFRPVHERVVGADDSAGDGEKHQDGEQHHRTSTTPSNIAAGSRMPAASSRSDTFGRTPVARKRPRTLPSWLTPCFSKTKISCIVMMSPSIPVISEMLVTLRVPSLRRVCCITIWMAEAICWRIALSGRFVEPIAIIVSTRVSASRGVFACTVVSEPSWPVFMAWSMSSASSPRTSPITMRSGRIRRAFTTSWRCRMAPFPSTLAGRVSSRATCSWCSWSSAASSMVTMRSSSEI